MKFRVLAALMFTALIGCGPASWFRETFGSEKISSVQDSQLPPHVIAAFHMLPNCGAVKVSASRPLYLSALHCFLEDERIVAARSDTSFMLGDLINYDWVVRYNLTLEGQVLRSGQKVVATGGSWTGFALDVVRKETPERVEAAAEALLGDWILFEDAAAGSEAQGACLPVGDVPAAGEPILALGRHERAALRVFSRGRVVGMDFIRHPSYRFANEWSADSLAAFERLVVEQRFMVSDADVWTGMSGGPVIAEERLLVGITTVKLEPNFCPLPDNNCRRSLYATHGAVAVRGLLAARPELRSLFDCE